MELSADEPLGKQAHEDGSTRCICGNTENFGVMVQCERCSVWQHCDCVNLNSKKLPDHYFCELCRSREVNNRASRTSAEKAKKNAKLALSSKFPERSKGTFPSMTVSTGYQDKKSTFRGAGAVELRKDQSSAVESYQGGQPSSLKDYKSTRDPQKESQSEKASEPNSQKQSSMVDRTTQPIGEEEARECAHSLPTPANTKMAGSKEVDSRKSEVHADRATTKGVSPNVNNEQGVGVPNQRDAAQAKKRNPSAGASPKTGDAVKRMSAKSTRGLRSAIPSRTRNSPRTGESSAQYAVARDPSANPGSQSNSEPKRVRTRTRPSSRKRDVNLPKDSTGDTTKPANDSHSLRSGTSNHSNSKRNGFGARDASHSVASPAKPHISVPSHASSSAHRRRVQSPQEAQAESSKRATGSSNASSQHPPPSTGVSKPKPPPSAYVIPENLIKVRSYHEKTSIGEMIRRVKRLSAHIICLQIMLASEEKEQESVADEARNCKAKNLARTLYTLDSPCLHRKRTRLSSTQRQNLKILGIDCLGNDEEVSPVQNRDSRTILNLSSDASTNTDYTLSAEESDSDYSINLQDWKPTLSLGRRRGPETDEGQGKSDLNAQGTSSQDAGLTSFEILDGLNLALTRFQEKFDKDAKKIPFHS